MNNVNRLVRQSFLWVFCFLLFFTPALAQVTTFQETLSGSYGIGYSVQQTVDGGYIITGHTASFSAGYSDVYLVKIHADGSLDWTKTFGGTSNEFGKSVQQTSDAFGNPTGYIITGTTWSFGAGAADVFLVKTDINGNSLWSKTFGGTIQDVGNSVRQTIPDGGYIIAGTVDGSSVSDFDVYLIKTDANGNVGPPQTWKKTFGGGNNDTATSVQQTTDGGYIITGYTESFGAGSKDVYLIKTDSAGNWDWVKTFGGTDDDIGHSVQQTNDGGYIVVGRTESFGSGVSDVYLIKTDLNGDLTWSKTFGGPDYDYSYSVQQTVDGGYVIGGNTYNFGAGYSDFYLIKTDSLGNPLWSKAFGKIADDVGYSVQQATDAGYIIVGHTYNFASTTPDVYVIKTDTNGNSGCNEANAATIPLDVTLITQVNSPTPTVSSSGTVNSPTPTMGSGGVVDILCTTVDIKELTANDAFSIFPNPCTGDFAITFDKTIDEGQVEVFDMYGQQVFGRAIHNTSKVEVKLENISEGIYVVRVLDGENQYTKKVVIK